MSPKCQHVLRCCLKQTDNGYTREDLCTVCKDISPCQHFRMQQQATRYGRDRFKPQAIVEDFDIAAIDLELE